MSILLILAFICFILAALNVPISRVNMVGLGLVFWVGAQLFGGRL